MEFTNCMVLWGPDLEPFLCDRFKVNGDTIEAIDRREPYNRIKGDGLVIIPGLYNSHTHMGDSCLLDGTTGLTLEEGFFRPDGYKYQELAKLSPEEQLPRIATQLAFMVRTGTIGHLDFREEGVKGAEILKAASEQVGLDSVILSQFETSPFDAATLLENKAELSDAYKTELDAMLKVAHGFSESTMNDMTDPAWQYVKARTKELGKFRAIHCLENWGYRDLSFKMAFRGDLIRAIELYEPNIVVHMTVSDDDEQQMLVDAGITGVLNPRANANLGLPLPPIRSLLDKGANLLLGTDNAMLNNSSMLAELDFTYKVAKSQYGDAVRPDPRDILKLATVNMGKAFGGDRHGYLEEGLPADFVVLDFSKTRLRHTHHLLASIVTRLGAEDVLGTFLKGRALYEKPYTGI